VNNYYKACNVDHDEDEREEREEGEELREVSEANESDTSDAQLGNIPSAFFSVGFDWMVESRTGICLDASTATTDCRFEEMRSLGGGVGGGGVFDAGLVVGSRLRTTLSMTSPSSAANLISVGPDAEFAF